MLEEFWYNFTHNLFKPLLLFFYMGFLVPVLRVPFEFPHVIYQGLTIYLLVSIGWKGGEELAALEAKEFAQAAGFMLVGFITNFLIGILAYVFLRAFTRVRQIDAATVAGYYGSDSAGTFVTCTGVLATIQMASAAYMPVMLAVMEIPGCLVALYLVSRLRANGMDPLGNMPGEPGYNPTCLPPEENGDGHSYGGSGSNGGHGGTTVTKQLAAKMHEKMPIVQKKNTSVFNWKIMHEVFLNPGLYLLFGGILIGFVSRLQGEKVVAEDDEVFRKLFQGILCLFLLEMGMTACKRLRDLRTAGWRFILFGLAAPNLFATAGIIIAHAYSMAIGMPFETGTYVLFAVLCGAASYIAVPAVQRLAIPEASPTLPLAASLGLTFTYNVTVGIPIYILIAKAVIRSSPVGG
jgi:hypothetical protein